MVTVYIEIKECGKCPHIDHDGRCQTVTHWVCGAMKNRKISVMEKGWNIGKIIEIPSWCPLREENKK